MIDFHESLRYVYPLTKDSLVIDAGGFEGNFAKEISSKYGCHVICYEPIHGFCRGIVSRMANGEISSDLVILVNAGVGATLRKEKFGIKGDQTGIACAGDPQDVSIVPIDSVVNGWLQDFQKPTLDLLKMNIESMEFECMEALLDSGTMSRIDHVQVQPHNIIPNAEERWASIKNRMAITHRLDYAADWIWYGWSSKEQRR